MYPAPSLILLTTLSGSGFGLMALLGLGLGPATPGAGALAAGIALALTLIGLGASAAHLKRPDRAWRAFSQWRSSWLSREAILAVLALALFFTYAAAWLAGGQRLAILGIPSAILSLAAVIATSMIYAQLRTVPRWATRLTPCCFAAFALSGGALVIAALSATPGTVGLALGLLCLAALAKAAWWHRARTATRSQAGASPEAATGLGTVGTVRRFELPHSSETYLTREMLFQVGRARAKAIRRLSLVLAFVLPLALVSLSAFSANQAFCVAAALFHLAGTLFERWLFFAEAEHVVGSYYGHR